MEDYSGGVLEALYAPVLENQSMIDTVKDFRDELPTAIKTPVT